MRKLSKDHTPVTPVSASEEGKIRLLTLGDLDNRTRAFRNAQTIIADMTSDLGGSLSTSQRVLVNRAAVATVLVESMEATWLAGKSVDLSTYNMTVNSLSRLLRILGIERKPHASDTGEQVDALLVDGDPVADAHDLTDEVLEFGEMFDASHVQIFPGVAMVDFSCRSSR